MPRWLRTSPIGCAVWLLAFGCSSPEPSDVSSAPPPITVARVDGEGITLEELDAWIKEDLFRKTTADGDPDLLHRTRERALRQLVDERILARIAETSGVDPDRVLQDALDALPPVTDAEITAFFEDHPRAFSGDSGVEAHRPQIRSFLERERRAKAVRRLRSRAAVEFDLPAPYDRFADGLPSRGPEAAAVTIVAFTDFACLDCARAEAVLNALRERYPDEVRLVYRYVPQEGASFHHGREAAEAAVCAQQLGAGWAYHDALFDHQRDLDADDLEAYARGSGLDPKALSDCRAAGGPSRRMEADARAATGAGVTRLPAFLVNGTLVTGTRSLPVMSGLVEGARRRLEIGAQRG